MMNRMFSELATYVAHQAVRPLAFLLAALCSSGLGRHRPIFNYSDTWQLIVNTGTTIVTSRSFALGKHPHTKADDARAAALDIIRRRARDEPPQRQRARRGDEGPLAVAWRKQNDHAY